MECYGVLWSVMECYGVLWSVMECYGRSFIKHAQSMARRFYTHCFLFSCIMYLSQLRRPDIRTAWWYLLSAC